MKSTLKKMREANPVLTSDRAVRAARAPAGGRAVFRIGNSPGLELRMSGPKKAWSKRYRLKGAKQQRVDCGTYPAVTFAEARTRAKEIDAAAARGVDLPAEEQRQREEERKAARRPQTVADLLDRYITDYCKPNQRRWQLVERIFEAHVKPAIGKRPLAELRRAHLVELLDDLQNEKGLRAQVNRVRSQVIAALNWAVEHELLDSNPAATIRKRRLEVSRDRVLTGQELRSIWKAAEALPEPSGSFVQVLILTAQRRDECRCMTWHEIDRPQALWLLPAGRNKSNRDHEIPLPPTIVKLLDRLKRLGEQVFTIDGERPYSGQKRLAAILVRNSGVTGWCFHDLRRTAASGMAALGVSIDVIERVLNHAKPGLVGVYNRHTYRSEMRAALEAWADHVAAVVAGAPAAWDEPAEPRQISRAAA